MFNGTNNRNVLAESGNNQKVFRVRWYGDFLLIQSVMNVFLCIALVVLTVAISVQSVYMHVLFAELQIGGRTLERNWDGSGYCRTEQDSAGQFRILQNVAGSYGTQ